MGAMEFKFFCPNRWKDTIPVIPTWNMLSSPLLLPLDEPPGLELSPLFGFLAGFSGALDFFLFA